MIREKIRPARRIGRAGGKVAEEIRERIWKRPPALIVSNLESIQTGGHEAVHIAIMLEQPLQPDLQHDLA